MIRDGERILVGISGGMDSLALLLLLHSRKFFSKVDYELFPVLVDNWNGENADYLKRVAELADFIRKETSLELTVLPVPAVKMLEGREIKARDTCYHCSQKRRKVLIQHAQKTGCGTIAFGHHLDDILETSLMNLFYKRELSSMLPRLDLFQGKMRIIRPLAYLEKSAIEEFVYSREDAAPTFGEVCPAKMIRRDFRRIKVRKLISELSSEIPGLRENIFAAFRHLLPDYLLDMHFQPTVSGKKSRP